MTWIRIGSALAATFWLALASSSAGAQAPDLVAEAEARFAHEPGVSESARRALEYFYLDPESFARLRNSSRTRALLPIFAAGYRYDDDNFTAFSSQTPTPRDVDEAQTAQTHAFNVGALWDLRQLAFNPAEVQVYGLVGVQRDIMLEVTRTFFLRRQLQLRMALKPPEEPLARAALSLRIQEFTAILDVLTGGWFTREAERRLERQNRSR